LDNLGITYSNFGQVEKAISYYKQALAIRQAIDDLSSQANSYYNLACGYALLNQIEQALPYLRQALVFNSVEYYDMTVKDSDFATIRESAAFQALLEEFAPVVE